MGFNIQFSWRQGHFKIPRQIPYPITVSYGEPMKSNANHNEVRREVVDLGTDAWSQRKGRISTIGAFIRTARRARGRMAFADSTGKELSYMVPLQGQRII